MVIKCKLCKSKLFNVYLQHLNSSQFNKQEYAFSLLSLLVPQVLFLAMQKKILLKGKLWNNIHGSQDYMTKQNTKQ